LLLLKIKLISDHWQPSCKMKVYPVFLNIDGKACLVVGGGAVGERKVQDLLLAGARVTLVSREITPVLAAMAAQKLITYLREDFSQEHLNGMVLVIAATNDLNTNQSVSVAAQNRGLPVNVVDQPALCSFVVPATIRRGDLTLAIGTGGHSPALAKKLRRDLEQFYGPEYGPYLELLGAIREKVLASRRDHPDNLDIFTRIVASPLLQLLHKHDLTGLQALLADLLGAVLPAAMILELQNFAADLSRPARTDRQ
jgi:precorrin-2 dehydrogenase / sirohydrochlorin ferrochelatase